MTAPTRWRGLLLWAAFVIFCGVAMAYTPLSDMKLPIIGKLTYYQVLLAFAALMGAGGLLRVAGGPERSVSRTMCRLLIAYMLFELLFVAPVALFAGSASVTAVLETMAVRFTWVLFPVLLALASDDKARTIASGTVIVVAACLMLWGLYLAATGGGGYYLDGAEVRFRILYGSATLLFAWPFVLAMAGVVSRRLTVLLIVISLVGLVLTNHRTGMIAFALAGVACVLLSGRARQLVAWLVPLGLAAAIGVALVGQRGASIFGYTFAHLFDFSSGNGADRLMRWRLAAEFFTARPINDYVWSWRYYLVNLAQPYQPHNFALEIAVTEGLAGIVFYLAVLTAPLRAAWAWVRRDAIARALFAYIFIYIAFSVGNANWYLPLNFALLVGGVAGLTARVDQLRRADAAGELDGSGTGPGVPA